MDLPSFLAQSPDLSDGNFAEGFASRWKRKLVTKGARLAHQGQSETDEFILLDGCLTSSICDQDGKEVCVGLHVGPCVVTPNIARTRDGVSLVSIQATKEASVYWIYTGQLTDLMIESEPIRNWANGILREALSAKSEREWCLAALGGKERLNWFRQAYPRYEDVFTHSLIASFLGITPVTMSRLRSGDKH